MSKRSLLFFVALACFALAACGTESQVDSSANVTTTTFPTPDEARPVLPETDVVVDESRTRNTNTGTSPIRRLCWITREVGLQIVEAAFAFDDQERAADQQQLDAFINAEIDALVDELDELTPQLDPSVQPFASGLAEQLAMVRESARERAGEDLPESPLFDMDFDAIPNQDEYVEVATAAGCEQLV